MLPLNYSVKFFFNPCKRSLDIVLMEMHFIHFKQKCNSLQKKKIEEREESMCKNKKRCLRIIQAKLDTSPQMLTIANFSYRC